jgi:molecular chaperone GrpE
VAESEGTPEEDAPVVEQDPPDTLPSEGEVAAEVPPPPPDPVAVVTKERDDYLDALRRLQAEFENYKKRMVRQQTDNLERAGEALVTKLLPVLDAVDLARDHGAGDDLEQVAGALLDTLGREGLERIDPVGELFDPNEHDAVQHEPGDHEHPVVSGLMRAGWRWKGRVLRPAMVVVKG